MQYKTAFLENLSDNLIYNISNRKIAEPEY